MRIFVGIELTERQRAAAECMARCARKSMPGKYVEPRNYHVTIAYIGETDEAVRDRAMRALEAAARASAGAAPWCALSAAGFFRRADKAILYCGVREEPGLLKTAQCVREALSEDGVPFDPTPFVPHITLGRNVRIDERTLAGLIPEACETEIAALTLFESARVDGVLRYTPLYRAPVERKRI